MTIESIHPGAHAFTHVIFAPPEYHKYFKGVLDSQRQALTLVVPIFRCEFSGTESAEEFAYMRRHTVDTLNWRRSVMPKVSLRFDNSKTSGGIPGDPLPVRFETLKNEIANLDGVIDGFIECTNWEGRVLEILSPQPNRYLAIWDRDDAQREECEKARLIDVVWTLLSDELAARVQSDPGQH